MGGPSSQVCQLNAGILYQGHVWWGSFSYILPDTLLIAKDARGKRGNGSLWFSELGKIVSTRKIFILFIVLFDVKG